MASPRRSTKRSLGHQLKTEPYRFSFVQSVRLLERICERQDPPRKSVGHDSLPEQECVRFRVLAARSFPATEVTQLEDFSATPSSLNTATVSPTREEAANSVAATQAADFPEESAESDAQRIQQAMVAAEPTPVAKLTVAFMGLFGPSGVLPQHDTQRIIDAGTKKNPERDFLDVFNHRILSFFYRASIKYRIPFSYESNYRKQPPRDGDAGMARALDCDLVTQALFSLAGLGTGSLRDRLETPNELAIEFAGLLGHQPKNAISLQRLLESYFKLPICVLQFVGQWMDLPAETVSEMPTLASPLGQNCALGKTFILGQRVWDIAGKFRLKIGPVDIETFESLLPNTANLIEVAQLAQLYAGNQFDFDIQIELLARDVPAIQLGGNSQLGHNTWLFAEQPTENKSEAIFVQSGLPLNAKFSGAA
jgi:type VI secretion system protein ImpH